MENQIQLYHDATAFWLDKEWKTPREKTLEKKIQELGEILNKLQLCPDCGASLHAHLFNDSFHLECVVCGYVSQNFTYPSWKARRAYKLR